MFKIKKVTDLSMDMNSYLLIKQGKVIVIDPGMNGQVITDYLQAKGYELEAILLTHGHYDHIRDIPVLYQQKPVDVWVHEKDYTALYDIEKNYSKAFGKYFILDKRVTIKRLEDKEIIRLNGEDIKVIHTPGHTFGSVMYRYEKQIFSGDTIFYDSIGRTDLFSGNFNAIRRSLNMIKTSLSNQDHIWPGHGKDGLFKDIKKENRYL